MKPIPKNFLIAKEDRPIYSFLNFFLISGDQSKVSEYLIFYLSELQYLAILLWGLSALLTSNISDPAITFVYNLTHVIVFEGFFGENSSSSFIQPFIVAIWIYFIFLTLAMGYLAYKAIHREQVKESLRTTLCSIFQFHYGFIFWFVNIVLMTLISDSSPTITLFSLFSREDKPFYFIQIAIITLNYAFGILTALFCFDPFCSTNTFASQTSFFQFTNFLFKAIIGPIFIFSPCHETYMKIIFIVISFLISFGRAIYLFYTFPFHYYTPMKLANFFSITNSWICLINILAIIFMVNGMSSPLSPIYLVILPLPVIIKLSLVRLHCLIEYYMSVNPQSLLSKRQIFQKLFAGRILEENVRLSLNDNVPLNRCELYFVGDLTLHSKSCEDTECLCSLYLRDKTKKGNNNNVIATKASLLAYFHTMNQLFLGEAIKKIKDSNDLKISVAHLILNHQAGSLSTALAYLFSTSEDTLNFFVRLKRNILAKKIQERMRTQSDESLKGDINWAEFVDYHTDATDFLSQIAANTENYINFWETFKRNDVRMTDMVEKSNQIEIAADRIDKLWIYYVERYETFYRLLKDAYKMYLILVRNAPFTSKKMVKKFQWKRKLKDVQSVLDEIHEEDLVSAQVISFYVSMMKEKIGRVLYVSDNIETSIGYSPQEVTGKNINFLLPPAIAEKHDQMLLRHLDRSKTSQAKDYFITKSYVKIKEGTLVPCSTHVAIFPYIQKELIYIGVMKVLPIKFECMILDSAGYIDSFTKGIGQKLSLYTGKRNHIRDVCINEERLGVNFDVKTLLVPNQTSRTDTYLLLHKDQSIPNINMSIGSHRMISNPDIETEFPETSVSLTFFKPGLKGKYFKYDVKVTKKWLINKKVYILEMERNFMPEQEQRFRKDSIEDELFKDIMGEPSIDIPTEMPLPAEIMGLTDSVAYRASMTGYITQRTEGVTDRPLINPRKASDSSEGRQMQLNSRSNVSRQLRSKHMTLRMDTKMEFEQEQDSDNDLMNIGVPGHVPGQDKSKKSIKSGKYLHKFFEMQSERGSTASTAHKIHPKLEKAIYSLPREKPTRILKLSIVGLLVTCIVLLLVFQGNTQENLQLMKGNVSVITTSNLRLFQITEMNRRTRAISLYLNGLFLNARYAGYKLKTLLPTVLALIGGIQDKLNTYNNDVRSNLTKIEPELQKGFYSNPIPVIGLDHLGGIEYLNTFDAATTIIVKAKQLVKLPTTQIKANNSEMNYILNNTLNELLLMSEDVTNIILDDNDYKLDYLRDLIIYFIVVCCMLGVIMLTLFFYNQFKSVQSRNKFIEMFLRLSDEEVDMNLNQVKVFKTRVSKNGLNFRHLQLDEITANPTNNMQQSPTKAAKSFRAKKRHGNVQGINAKVFLAQIFAVSLFILALAPLIYISITVNQKKNIIKDEVSTIVQVNTHLYDLNLISSAIYEYIQFNETTTVRTRPINEEWEATYRRVAGSQAFFASLFQVKNGNKFTTDPELELLLTGNLCQAMNASELICSLGKGVLDNGIMGMNSFVLLTLRQVKDTFDTNRTLLGAKAALGIPNLVDIEYLYAVMQLPAYEKLGEILQARVETHIQEVEDLLKAPVMISVGLYIVLGYLISKHLVKLVREERIKWKKMFRKIPFNVVINNKQFKNFLVKETGRILSSVKSSI